MHAGFGRGIGTHAGARLQRTHRADVDDPSRAGSGKMRYRRARRIQCGEHVQRIHSLPGLRIAVDDGLEGKTAGDVNQRVDPAEVRRDGVNGCLGRCRLGQVDAAYFDAISGCRDLGCRVIDAADARAPRQRGFKKAGRSLTASVLYPPCQ